MKFKMVLLFFCLIFGLTSFAIAHDGYYSKRYRNFDRNADTAQLESCIGSLATVTTNDAFDLIARLNKSGFLTKEPEDTVNYDYWLKSMNVLAKWSGNKKDIQLVQWTQTYKAIPVYGTIVNLELIREDENAKWTFLSLSFTIADINTTRPTGCMPRKKVLKAADEYLKERYVLVKNPGIYKEPCNVEILDIVWKIHDDSETWGLSFITRHNYYLDTEEGIPIAIGLELDAFTGKVLGEIPRCSVGCFGPPPVLKKPK